MKKLSKIFYCNVALLLFILLLVGCTDDTNKKSTTKPSENNSTSLSEPTSGSEKSSTDDSSDTSSENKQNENNVSKEKDDSETNISKKETDKETFQEKTNIDTKQTNADENDQKKAISLVKDYLRDKKELVEDGNHFVEYDGESKNYIIVRYSTLVSGHSSTNGRYAVDINSGEIVDITANPDFLNK